MLIDTLSYNRNIRLSVTNHLGDGRRTALLDGQCYLRITFDKFRHNQRQGITCLRMSRRNNQRTTVMISKLTAYIFNILHIAQNPFYNFQHSLAGLRHRNHAFAAADKNLYAQLLLKKPDLLGNTRLGGKKGFSSFRHIQIMPVHLQCIP